MSNRFRFTTLTLGLLGGAILAPRPGAAAESYLAQGLPFFAPYRVAIATLDVSGGKVSGTLAAPIGDPRPAMPLSGTLADGTLNLTIGSGADAVSLAFTGDERDSRKLWEEATPVAGLSDVVLFQPSSGFSATALAVQHQDSDWCGRFEGALSLQLRAEALKTKPQAPEGLGDLDVVLAAFADTATAKLSGLWPRLRLAALSGDDVTIDIQVPVGSEAKRAEQLRRLPEVVAVNLASGCGEMALVSVPREQLMDGEKVSADKLKSFADNMLARFLSGAQPEAAAPGTHKFKLLGAKVVEGADGLIHYEAALSGDAEVTRLGSAEVDAFTLTLAPAETVADTAETISLAPRIADLKSAKRPAKGAPPESAFAPVEDEAVFAAIGHRLVSWLAAAQGTGCAFLTQTAFEEPENSLSCANVALDGLSEEGGGD